VRAEEWRPATRTTGVDTDPPVAGIKTVIVIITRSGDQKGPDLTRNELRPVIKLRSTAGTGYTYVTTKNRRNEPGRLTLRKYDPTIRRHVEFREER
jgi:large subunit ribosomal protein L33